MHRKKESNFFMFRIWMIAGAVAVCFAIGMFSGCRYINGKVLASNESIAQNVSLVIANNFTITDAEVAYMKTLDFNGMEVDAINERFTDVGTGICYSEPVISIYVIVPLLEAEITYYVDSSNAAFFGLPEGTALDAMWLLNTAVDDQGNRVLKDREDIYRYTHPDAQVEKALKEQTSFGAYTTDEWGEVISGYAPLYTQEGTFVGLVGVDMDTGEYQHDVNYVITAFFVVIRHWHWYCSSCFWFSTKNILE